MADDAVSVTVFHGTSYTYFGIPWRGLPIFLFFMGELHISVFHGHQLYIIQINYTCVLCHRLFIFLFPKKPVKLILCSVAQFVPISVHHGTCCICCVSWVVYCFSNIPVVVRTRCSDDFHVLKMNKQML